MLQWVALFRPVECATGAVAYFKSEVQGPEDFPIGAPKREMWGRDLSAGTNAAGKGVQIHNPREITGRIQWPWLCSEQEVCLDPQQYVRRKL